MIPAARQAEAPLIPAAIIAAFALVDFHPPRVCQIAFVVAVRVGKFHCPCRLGVTARVPTFGNGAHVV